MTDQTAFDEADELIVERTDGVVRITLNRPALLNALTVELFERLGDVLRDIRGRADDRAVVITGAGRGFCSGADLSGGMAAGESVAGVMRRINDTARALHDLPQPTLAAVNGVAAGAGMNLALGCDILVASNEARFSQVFVKRGLSLDFGGSWLLPRLVGFHTARRLALLGDTITATEAERIGLITQIVDAGQLMTTANELASRLAAGPPIAMALTKQLLDHASETGFDAALEAEAMAVVVNSATADTVEAGVAFIERRTPRFTGR